MRKKSFFAIFLALIVIFVTACKAQTPAVADPNLPDAEGYYTLGQKAAGGTPMENSNAKSLSITEGNGLSVITMSFVLGSKLSNVDEATAQGIPSYRVFGYEKPDRLVLELENLAFWDYDRKVDIQPDDALLFGIFKQTLTESSRFHIYFQLKQPVDFKIEEKGDRLSITLRPKLDEETEETEKYYVTANAAQPLDEASIGTIGLAPTLCEDLNLTLLISAPFDTREDAEAQKAHILEMTESNGVLSEKQLDVISLLPSQLPKYNVDLDFQHVYDQNIVRVDGVQRKLPVVMPDGLYLCTAPDGRRMLFSKLLTTQKDVQSEDDEPYMDAEQLWIVEPNGRKKQLMDFEFSSVQEAAFSPNGKLLAILERSADASYLHIFDMETNRLLYNLSEEGFGDSTDLFVWDTMGTAIYAVGGTEKVRLLKYDFTIPDETKRVSMVEDQDIEAGNLSFLGGELYFTDSIEGVSKVYKIKPEGGVRVPVTGGNSFSISPDGKFMLVQDVTAIGGEGEETTNNTSLKVMNMATKEEIPVIKDVSVVSMGWGYQNKIYFSMGDLEKLGEETYPFKLMQFDLESKETREVAEMMTAYIYPSGFQDEILLPYMDSSDTESIRATYLLSMGE